jgi:hypothetical protein
MSLKFDELDRTFKRRHDSHPIAQIVGIAMSASAEQDRASCLDSFLQKRMKAKTARTTGGSASVSISIFDLPPGLLVPLDDATVSCTSYATWTMLCNEKAAAKHVPRLFFTDHSA